MTDDLITRSVSSGDQWLALKRDTIQSCPNDVLGRAFFDVCRACEVYDDKEDEMTLEWMAAIVIRCELHTEVVRRLQEGVSTIAQIEGREP